MDWGSKMMTREDAERIADTMVAIRPEWVHASIMTILHDLRARTVRDVHLAAIWIAYDPTTRTPARLREAGPWWQLRDMREATPQVPSVHERWRHEPPTTPAPPETRAECLARIRAAAERREETRHDMPT